MTSKGSRLAEIRKKFESKNDGFAPTPESQFGRMKKAKVNQAKAVRIARARAARYNMTLRSLAIKTNTDVTKMQRNDMSAKKSAQAKAAKYNMTSRALPVATVSKKDRENIAAALEGTVSPSLAKDVIKAVATKHHADDVQATTSLVRPERATRKKRTLPPPQEEEPEVEQVKKPVKKEAADDENTPESGKKGFEMKGLGDALASGDEDALNRSILENFLETSAPQLLGKRDELLDKYKSQLHVLFDKLLKNYGATEDARVAGEQKADKEISEAVQGGDVRDLPAEAEATGDDDDDSMIITPENIDVPETAAAATKPATTPVVDELDDDDDSLIIAQDEAMNEGYEATIRAAEENPTAALEAAARRKQTVAMEKTLTRELKTYNDAKKSMMTTVSEDSLIQTDEPTPQMMETGYIVGAELEEENVEREEPSRWAVQFQNKNYALKQKLLKQGLSPDQVEELVDNLEKNTSEML